MFCFLLQRYYRSANTMFVKQNNLVILIKEKGVTITPLQKTLSLFYLLFFVDPTLRRMSKYCHRIL